MRKIKFPLEMANGAQVRNMEELRESFDLEAALGYFVDGKLLTWLEDRYYEDEAEKVEALSKDDPALARKLCAALGVTCPKDASVDAEEIAYRKERLARLRQYTEEEEILAQVDKVAFDQEDLADLYDMGVDSIYLCASHFRIPRSKQGLTYIPIAGATADGVTLAKPEAKPEEKPAPIAPKASEIKIGVTDGKIIVMQDGKKRVLAEFGRDEICHVCNNDRYVFADLGGNICSVRRFDIESGEAKDIMGYMSFNKFCATETHLYWNECFHPAICRCDLDGDFREVVASADYDQHICEWCLHDGEIYYIKTVSAGWGNSPKRVLEKVNLETGTVTSLGSAQLFCIGGGKIYVYTTEGYAVSEWDMDGTHLRTLKEGLHLIDRMDYNNGVVSCYPSATSSFMFRGNDICRIKV